MNPPIATKARARSAVSIEARLNHEELPSRSDRERLLRVEPDLLFFFRVVSGEEATEPRDSAGAAARAGLAAAGPLDGQTMATEAPRSALSRSSVSVRATAAESQGRSV